MRLRLTLFSLLVACGCGPALEIGRDHPAHPDAPQSRPPARTALLAVDAGIDEIVAPPDAGPGGHAHHHHHGGSP